MKNFIIVILFLVVITLWHWADLDEKIIGDLKNQLSNYETPSSKIDKFKDLIKYYDGLAAVAEQNNDESGASVVMLNLKNIETWTKENKATADQKGDKLGSYIANQNLKDVEDEMESLSRESVFKNANR